jgi:3-phenylpropionate/trans-cinnamate dioxygenase ferredoxin subunit
MSEAKFQAVAMRDAVPEGGVKVVEVGGLSILICDSNGTLFAIENRCSHAEEKLECGRMRQGWIACPVHGARFRLETGEPMNPPATAPIRTFALRVVEGQIEIAI